MPAPKAGAIDQTRRLGEKLERVEGIEPSHLAWQASRLPLHHTRMVPDDGYDPTSRGYQPRALPLS